MLLLGGLVALAVLVGLMMVAMRRRDAGWRQFLVKAFAYVEGQQRCMEELRIGQWQQFEYDQETGKVVFLQDGRPEVVADFLFAGTTSRRSGTWLWSWANPSLLPAVSEKMAAVALYGKEHGFPALCEAKQKADDTLGGELTAAAAYVLQAKGVYRHSSEVGTTFLVFTDVGFATELSEDLFHQLDPEALDVLLEDWRWLVGPDDRAFKVTVFGDVFTLSPDGHVHFLDTGRGGYSDVAESVEQWRKAARIHGSDWFHMKVLRQLREIDLPPPEGQVYSWTLPVRLGGAEELDNIGFASARVHVSHLGRLAESVEARRVERQPGVLV